mmetsp:Transcript_63360/g.181783  ORF Transcript_63360/g.181783 Transcript_63360/m.181783 type:complete len:211 (-) Transcript_63360:816-1448(-)
MRQRRIFFRGGSCCQKHRELRWTMLTMCRQIAPNSTIQLGPCHMMTHPHRMCPQMCSLAFSPGSRCQQMLRASMTSDTSGRPTVMRRKNCAGGSSYKSQLFWWKAWNLASGSGRSWRHGRRSANNSERDTSPSTTKRARVQALRLMQTFPAILLVSGTSMISMVGELRCMPTSGMKTGCCCLGVMSCISWYMDLQPMLRMTIYLVFTWTM